MHIHCLLTDNTDHTFCLMGLWCVLLLHNVIFILKRMVGQGVGVATWLRHVIFHLNAAVAKDQNVTLQQVFQSLTLQYATFHPASGNTCMRYGAIQPLKLFYSVFHLKKTYSSGYISGVY